MISKIIYQTPDMAEKELNELVGRDNVIIHDIQFKVLDKVVAILVLYSEE